MFLYQWTLHVRLGSTLLPLGYFFSFQFSIPDIRFDVTMKRKEIMKLKSNLKNPLLTLISRFNDISQRNKFSSLNQCKYFFPAGTLQVPH